MSKKKTKKRDNTKAQEKAAKFFKKVGNILVATIDLAAMLAFIAIPFLHGRLDDVVAQCIWYLACVLYVVFSVVSAFSKPKKAAKYPLLAYLGKLGFFPTIVVFGSAFLINYYDTFYNWWWAMFAFVALFIPFFTFGIHHFLKKEKKYTDEQSKASLKLCWKYVGFYWLIDLFYMAIFNYWPAYGQARSFWLTLQYVFGGLAMLLIFYNLARAFLISAKKHGWGLLQDFIWGVAITVYLIYLIPNSTLQTIVLTITAAVYGGLLTLVGVAWTIKDNAEKLKQERKLSIKPYLQVHHSFLTKVDEIPFDDILYITIGENIVIQRKLPEEINAFLSIREHTEKSLDAAAKVLMSAQYFASHALIYTEIENCGAGNAIDTKLKYNDGTIASFCVSTSTQKKILLILKEELIDQEENEYFEIKLSFEYTDVSSLGKYEQREFFFLFRDERGNLNMTQMQEDLLTAPEEIV